MSETCRSIPDTAKPVWAIDLRVPGMQGRVWDSGWRIPEYRHRERSGNKPIILPFTYGWTDITTTKPAFIPFSKANQE